MDVIRQLLAVALVLALTGAAVWTLRRRPIGPVASHALLRLRWPRTPGAQQLERIGRLALTPQHTLHLVRIQGRELVVATHPHGCSILDVVGGAGPRGVPSGPAASQAAIPGPLNGAEPASPYGADA